ncbi:MAG: hypothetical protein F6K10_19120 [Moorea sp. SIO2B7]|nr:hypothetical protein [Moorena sp. SIO2B7]
MSDLEAETPKFPNTWQEIQANEIYQSKKGRLVSFSITQIKLGTLYDFYTCTANHFIDRKKV